MELIWPTVAAVPSYAAALSRGWSPDTTSDAAIDRELQAIERDAAAFVDSLVDLEAAGPPIELPDGTLALRLPGYRRWMWDGEFCGTIGFRWAHGTEELPSHVLGHIGYSVVPWKRQRGYATEALRQLLPDVWSRGLQHVELTTDVDNVASQRVIESNGGFLVERFAKPAAYGGSDGLRYRILRPAVGETDLQSMLSTLTVTRRDGQFVVCTQPHGTVVADAHATITEAEGATIIVERAIADARGLTYDFVGAWLTIEVHSSLQAVGLTAALAAALAADNIPCNVLAGFYHDHLLVPAERADAAVDALTSLRGN